MNSIKLTYWIFFILFSTTVFAQSNKQQQLEEQRQRLRQEIEQINQLRKSNKIKERSVLEEVQDLNSQISVRSNLIKVTNKQTNLLTREINVNQKKISTYRDELESLRKDYARMIVKSFKSKSQQSRIMFLLSSTDFLQAYKRLQYMKQYNKRRKEQGVQIEERTQALQSINKDLVGQKKQKEKLVLENREAQRKLKEEKKEQQVLVTSIRKKEGSYTAQIKKKEKEASAIDKAIEKLIREAIARANKKSSTKKVSKKGSATTFALTAEAKKLADNFTSNKGKLPWPVGTGRIYKKFGKQPHPTLKNIIINNSGVEIETKSGEKARAIFGGEVSTVQSIKGAGKLVQIRHGNYITTYYNLEKITVKEGQKLDTKQAIGQVRTNPINGRAILKFMIYQDAKRLNPQHWIFKM